MLTRRIPTVLTSAAIIFLLTGCSYLQKADVITHSEAKAEIESLLGTAQLSVGGTWEFSDGGAQNCNLAGGGQGAKYSLNRIGPGVPTDNQKALIDEIVAAWARQGIAASVSTKPEVNGVIVTQVRYPDGGVGSDGFYFELWVSHRASTISGQTRCGSGDADEINTN